MKLNILLIIILILLLYNIINKKYLKSNIKLDNIYIDKIIYINLDNRIDRKNQIINELEKMNLKYERFPAIKNENGALGCSKSHLEVIKLAKEKKYKNILVLEDDFDFLVNKDEFNNQINKLFQIDFDVCLLAYNTPNLYNSEFPFLYKIIDAQTTSGYIVNSKYYDTLIKHWEFALDLFEQTGNDTKYTCDQSWKILQQKDNWYCFKKRIGKQRKSYSDIQKGIIDSNV